MDGLPNDDVERSDRLSVMVVDGSEKNHLSATGVYVLKYHLWYDQLIDRAKGRQVPSCYTEVHHIVPRSIGGTDAPQNLVRLTYREHFLAHWMLTKFCRGADLRKMQRALWAMTLDRKGQRIVTGWQFDAAKRVIRDLELDPETERQWYERWAMQRAEFVKRRGALVKRSRKNKRPGSWARHSNRTALSKVTLLNP